MSKIYKPLRDKVIVKVYTGEEKTKGGIIIPGSTQEQMAKEEGTIIAIGKACFYDTEPEDLKIGDKVAFAKYAGKTLSEESDGTQIRTMRDIDILCVIEEKEVENVRTE